mgnify:CR=1 FL=1
MNQGNMWYPLGPLYTTSGVWGGGLASLFLDKRYRIYVMWDINRKEKDMNRKELTKLCNDITLALVQPVMIKSGYQCNDCGTYNKPDYMFNEKKCMDCITLEEAEERGV